MASPAPPAENASPRRILAAVQDQLREFEIPAVMRSGPAGSCLHHVLDLGGDLMLQVAGDQVVTAAGARIGPATDPAAVARTTAARCAHAADRRVTPASSSAPHDHDQSEGDAHGHR